MHNIAQLQLPRRGDDEGELLFETSAVLSDKAVLLVALVSTQSERNAFLKRS